MDRYFELLQRLFEEHGALIVFPVLLLENFPFIGFVAPAMSLLILAGFALAFNIPDLLTILCVAYFAVLTGDNLWFFLGRKSRGHWSALRRVNSRAQAVLEVISTQPRWVLYLYQFPPYFRMFLPFGLGMSAFPVRRWLLVSVVSSFVFVSTFLSLGFGAARALAGPDDAQDMGKLVTYAITVFAILYLVKLIRRYRAVRRKALSSTDTGPNPP